MLKIIASGILAITSGVVLAGGNALGAYLGSVFTVHKGDKWIRVFLVVTVVVMIVKLLNLHKFIGF